MRFVSIRVEKRYHMMMIDRKERVDLSVLSFLSLFETEMNLSFISKVVTNSSDPHPLLLIDIRCYYLEEDEDRSRKRRTIEKESIVKSLWAAFTGYVVFPPI